MNELTKWLPKIMLKFGSVLFIASLVMIFDCLILSSIFCDCFKQQIIFTHNSSIKLKEEASKIPIANSVIQTEPPEKIKEQPEEEEKQE